MLFNFKMKKNVVVFFISKYVFIVFSFQNFIYLCIYLFIYLFIYEHFKILFKAKRSSFNKFESIQCPQRSVMSKFYLSAKWRKQAVLGEKSTNLPEHLFIYL